MYKALIELKAASGCFRRFHGMFYSSWKASGAVQSPEALSQTSIRHRAFGTLTSSGYGEWVWESFGGPIISRELLCPVDQLVRLINWATFLAQYVNIYHLTNWAAIDKWQMTDSQ
jgi:hypothetical protein